MTTMREIAQAAYTEVASAERLEEMARADADRVRRERQDAERREQGMWAHLIAEHPDNPLNTWFPEEHWHLTDLPEYNGRRYIIVTAESEMERPVADRMHFMVCTDPHDPTRVVGVTVTTMMHNSDGWSHYWSGPLSGDDPLAAWLTGPADIGRYLVEREAANA